jgi:hypothetical protein
MRKRLAVLGDIKVMFAKQNSLLSEGFRSLLDRLEGSLGTLPTKNLELLLFQFIGCDKELD